MYDADDDDNCRQDHCDDGGIVYDTAIDADNDVDNYKNIKLCAIDKFNKIYLLQKSFKN